MRRLRYSVAMSLDGYIAGPNGEYDWIAMDPDIDFAAVFAAFDTALMGRMSYEAARRQGTGGGSALSTYVFSRTLRQEDCPGVTLSDRLEDTVLKLKAAPGKDIWLWGGGGLFRSCLDLGLVDSVELAVVPVLLGGGLPMLPTRASRQRLELTKHRVYSKTGTVLLEYAVKRGAGPP